MILLRVDFVAHAIMQQKENKIESASSTRLLLSDTRFCTAKEDGSEPSCDGKLVLFGLQVSDLVRSLVIIINASDCFRVPGYMLCF